MARILPWFFAIVHLVHPRPSHQKIWSEPRSRFGHNVRRPTQFVCPNSDTICPNRNLIGPNKDKIYDSDVYISFTIFCLWWEARLIFPFRFVDCPLLASRRDVEFKTTPRKCILRGGAPPIASRALGSCFPIIFWLLSCWWKTFRSPRKGGGEEKKEEKGEGKKGRKGRPLTSPLSIECNVNIGANIIYAWQPW